MAFRSLQARRASMAMPERTECPANSSFEVGAQPSRCDEVADALRGEV